MAKKKGDKKPPKAGDTSWMDAFMAPTQRQYQQFLRGQQRQFRPMIQTLRGQLAGLQDAGKDPTVRAYESLLGALPSSEAVTGAYGTGVQNVAQYLQGIDMARGGRGVSEALGAIGGALGVEGAGDIAQAAGTVSGIGEAGGDVMSKALMQAAAGQFKALETERLGQLGEQRQALTLGAGEARKAVREQRRELARMLAEARGQRIGAAPNPLDVANAFMQYQQNRKTLAGLGRGGAGGATTTTPGGDGAVVDITQPTEIERFLVTGGANEYLPIPKGESSIGGILRPMGPKIPRRPAPGRR